MQIGDKVNWAWVSRGGYGYRQIVAAVVVAINPKTVRIRTAMKVRDESEPSGWYWETVEKNVDEQFLSVRTMRVPEVDDSHDQEEVLLAAMPALHHELVRRTAQGMRERGKIKIIQSRPKRA